MSGDLIIKQGKIKLQKHDRLIFYLPHFWKLFTLVFNDTRKFGRVWLTNDMEKVLGKLGPEPLSNGFTSQWLYDSLRSRHRQLKPLLLDQTFLAGLGNIYTDEALHMAKLHPQALSDSVTANQAKNYIKPSKPFFKRAFAATAPASIGCIAAAIFKTISAFMAATANRVRYAARLIEKIIVGQRGTHLCPNCQKG